MKYCILLFLLLFILLSCNNDDCFEEKKILGYGMTRLDSNPNSPFYRQGVLDFWGLVWSNVQMGKLCKGSDCIGAQSMRVVNLSPKDMDLTLNLAGQGDYTFFIAKGDTIKVTPLPNFCLNYSWGEIKEIKYK